MKRSVVVAALLVGTAVGYAATIALSGPTIIQPSNTPAPGLATTSTGADTTATLPPDVGVATPTTTPDPDTTYLVWSTGGLPPALTEALVARFDQVSIVKGDVVELDAPDDAVIPLDALAIDPDAHRPFDPDGDLSLLQPGTVVLSETSTQLRQAAVGDMLTLAANSYQIVAIAPDQAVAAAEIVFASSEATHPVQTARYALIATDMARSEFESMVRSMYDGPAPMRIRLEAETPWLRHGDAVLPQVLIKLALGEFSYTNRVGGEFDQSPSFIDEWIVTAEVPIVGEVVCHDVVTDMLIGAMTQLVDEGLAHLVDPAGFAGCWNPRFTRSVTGSSAGLSRHAWGAAVDINAPANAFGSAGTQDARLVNIMQAWGFTWGGDWLVPDPMHFEYSSQPRMSR